MTSIGAIASRLRSAIDPLAFAERIGVPLYDYQAAVIESTARQQILNWSRQAGKSSVTSIVAAHQARFVPDSLSLILSPSERQSKLLLAKTKDALRSLEEPGLIVNPDSTMDTRLSNGSEIVALPGKEETVRGYSSVDLLIVDEASRASDALYHAIRPMLAASNGRLILLSTTFGKRGFFYREWTSGGDGWHRTEVPATQVPHISAEFLEEERRSLPPQLFAQEYLCQFVDTLDQIFSAELVAGLMSDDVQPLFEDATWSRLLTPTPALSF